MRLALAVLVSSVVVAPAIAQDVYLPSAAVTLPTAIRSPAPPYTPDAMLRRIQGAVSLQVDVRPDGTVGTVALVKSLYPELDETAVATVRQWRFTPGTKDGKPVAVRVSVEVEFRLR
jgi:protein TonB